MRVLKKLLLLVMCTSMTGCITVRFEQYDGPMCTTGSVIGAAAGGYAGAKYAGRGKGKILTGIGGALAGAMVGESVCRAVRD